MSKLTSKEISDTIKFIEIIDITDLARNTFFDSITSSMYKTMKFINSIETNPIYATMLLRDWVSGEKKLAMKDVSIYNIKLQIGTKFDVVKKSTLKQLDEALAEVLKEEGKTSPKSASAKAVEKLPTPPKEEKKGKEEENPKPSGMSDESVSDEEEDFSKSELEKRLDYAIEKHNMETESRRRMISDAKAAGSTVTFKSKITYDIWGRTPKNVQKFGPTGKTLQPNNKRDLLRNLYLEIAQARGNLPADLITEIKSGGATKFEPEISGGDKGGKVAIRGKRRGRDGRGFVEILPMTEEADDKFRQIKENYDTMLSSKDFQEMLTMFNSTVDEIDKAMKSDEVILFEEEIGFVKFDIMKIKNMLAMYACLAKISKAQFFVDMILICKFIRIHGFRMPASRWAKMKPESRIKIQKLFARYNATSKTRGVTASDILSLSRIGFANPIIYAAAGSSPGVKVYCSPTILPIQLQCQVGAELILGDEIFNFMVFAIEYDMQYMNAAAARADRRKAKDSTALVRVDDKDSRLVKVLKYVQITINSRSSSISTKSRDDFRAHLGIPKKEAAAWAMNKDRFSKAYTWVKEPSLEMMTSMSSLLV